MDDDAREKALIEILRVDYDAALRFIAGVVATSAAIRAGGLVVWAAAVVQALDKSSALLGALALAATVVFGVADAWHAALYAKGFERARGIESLLDAYATRLGIDADDDDAVAHFRARLEGHRFGFYRTLSPVAPGELLVARPMPVFRLVYPLLLLAAAGVTVAAAC
jgi:hypothetical protein